MSNNPQNYVSHVKPLAESYLAHSQDFKHGRNTQSLLLRLLLLLLHRGRVTNCTVVLCNHTTVFFNDGFQNRNDGPGWAIQPKMHETCTYHNSLSLSPKNKYICEESASLFHHLEPLFIGHWQARLHIRYTPQTPHPESSSHRQPLPEEGGRHSSGSNRLLLVPSRLLNLRTLQTTTTWKQLLSSGKLQSSQYKMPKDNKTRPSVLLTLLQCIVLEASNSALFEVPVQHFVSQGHRRGFCSDH